MDCGSNRRRDLRRPGQPPYRSSKLQRDFHLRHPGEYSSRPTRLSNHPDRLPRRGLSGNSFDRPVQTSRAPGHLGRRDGPLFLEHPAGLHCRTQPIAAHDRSLLRRFTHSCNLTGSKDSSHGEVHRGSSPLKLLPCLLNYNALISGSFGKASFTSFKKADLFPIWPYQSVYPWPFGT